MTFNNDQVRNALHIQIHMLVQMYVNLTYYQWFGTQIINLKLKIIKYNVTYHKFFSATTFYYLVLV